ncbi:putative FBD-associated F-box protein [Cardamine amara subsp. amara]|uniref:FBD-associated F-box protein n=1 Tax=Cardamine amara subsp. amara TaxID=228776 RepID=A0ABD1AZK2_CARAN
MENQNDTFSEFPDELLLKILSSLPSKDVVATSVLSKRWRSLWKEVNTFRYDGECPDRSLSRFQLFISRRSSVDILELKLNPHFKYEVINPLINMAVMRSLRELRIDMLYTCFKFPKSFNVFSQLETIILEKLSLVDVPSSNFFLPCIKSLHLLSVKFSGDESVRKLLSICPSLEDLVVKRSSYTNVMIFTIDVPTLTSLSIDNSAGKSRPKCVHGFVVNAPSLKCFSIRDSFSNYLRFENMPELVKASVNVVCDEPDKFLGSFASTQYLSLCSVTSQYLQTPYPPTSFLFLDRLELCSCSVEWWNLLTRILDDAPRLRVLQLKLYRKHCVQYQPDSAPWYKPDSTPECLLLHLEMFEWSQYKGTEQETQVAKYILANASCLKKGTFYSDSTEKREIFKELECVARGSKTCQLVFE